MKTIKFKCDLLTDVILNTKSASEGNNTTLDFIPGNAFLGIAASRIYKQKGECGTTADIFHSGRVRFGDAHPAVGNKRTLKIPALFFQDKVNKAEIYIHHHLNNPDALKLNEIQLKQCRNGFYIFDKGIIRQGISDKSFAIKSAHNKDRLTSKDKCMYGYESLRKGMTLFFTVELEDEKYAKDVIEALKGERHIGRSRTAQYGLVEISEFNFDDTIESVSDNEGLITVYADGRLIFIDEETGLPTFQPTPEQLGVNGGTIRWDLSQIRTFQYSPWNFTRQAYDFDRCGIEKGSVFVIGGATSTPGTDDYVGCFKNEGFGKVVYNPGFLDYTFNEDGNGISKYIFEKKITKDIEDANFKGDDSTDLLKYISAKYREKKINETIFKEVNEYVDKNKRYFTDDKAFASQWGHIRTLAMQFNDDKKLYDALFSTEKGREGYLQHGVAHEKWSDRRRLRNLQDECDRIRNSAAQLPLYLYLVNLASQMQKIFRNKK